MSEGSLISPYKATRRLLETDLEFFHHGQVMRRTPEPTPLSELLDHTHRMTFSPYTFNVHHPVYTAGSQWCANLLTRRWSRAGDHDHYASAVSMQSLWSMCCI
ncbi:hypothetical protein TNCV_426001 [Trichonephila clavipes]|nr:hypothetical protein TNCV_426001 [Trichonephila clavipes]